MSDVSIYKCKDGRVRVYLKDAQKVISYPRYIMKKHLGRELLWNEQVHHKDENPLNNDIDNLEIKLLGEHQKEHSQKYHDKWVVCGWCNKPFMWTAEKQRKYHSNHSRKNKKYTIEVPFCSQSCIGSYGRYVQLQKLKEK